MDNFVRMLLKNERRFYTICAVSALDVKKIMLRFYRCTLKYT